MSERTPESIRRIVAARARGYCSVNLHPPKNMDENDR